jgi:2-polyprenyl-3-methyl-5-hydroxy-6-metoxy-1,4-benzoquinol methylase
MSQYDIIIAYEIIEHLEKKIKTLTMLLRNMVGYVTLQNI